MVMDHKSSRNHGTYNYRKRVCSYTVPFTQIVSEELVLSKV